MPLFCLVSDQHNLTHTLNKHSTQPRVLITHHLITETLAWKAALAPLKKNKSTEASGAWSFANLIPASSNNHLCLPGWTHAYTTTTTSLKPTIPTTPTHHYSAGESWACKPFPPATTT
jgi:hypothetical protein